MELTQPILKVASSGFEVARQQRARALRKVLDAANLGAAGAITTPEALEAAQSLLDLGFPHAFELTPDELLALRSSQRGRGILVPVLAALSLPFVVLSGICFAFVGGVGMVELRYEVNASPVAIVAVALLSTWVAFGAGFDVLRLCYRASDPLRAARRLLAWSASAAVLLAIGLVAAALLQAPWGHGLGLANAGLIVPFTLTLALLTRRRHKTH